LQPIESTRPAAASVTSKTRFTSKLCFKQDSPETARFQNRKILQNR
jgi:hypothetical protein